VKHQCHQGEEWWEERMVQEGWNCSNLKCQLIILSCQWISIKQSTVFWVHLIRTNTILNYNNLRLTPQLNQGQSPQANTQQAATAWTTSSRLPTPLHTNETVRCSRQTQFTLRQLVETLKTFFTPKLTNLSQSGHRQQMATIGSWLRNQILVREGS
jgi:hypothetical protein